MPWNTPSYLCIYIRRSEAATWHSPSVKAKNPLILCVNRGNLEQSQWEIPNVNINIIRIIFCFFYWGRARAAPGFEGDSLRDSSATPLKHPPAVGTAQQDCRGLVIILHTEGKSAFQPPGFMCSHMPTTWQLFNYLQPRFRFLFGPKHLKIFTHLSPRHSFSPKALAMSH